ncbi:hypothetical protein [Bifidobacterium eulemuris]|uniref:DUF559 domain-containing protein n=1 Tax=Bifidobacterium eulemuris TaxID=1765219 RepID=A0A261GEX3_9BIFI|nr:hypothetical protein [Bifidobacterium eulemuris]OZG69595.1 hypothetical protein BEUL_0012 [Bifidobacterium eulemuris]QOL32288.1 hypothetical protein BE0216_07330 [Bifidobacterium eulemuris]
MNQRSLSLTGLTELKHQRMQACADTQERVSAQYVYALTTALELLAVEKPLMPRGVQRADRLYVVARAHNTRFRAANLSFVTWPWPLDTTTVERKFTCTSPACTWAMMSTIITLEELIVLGDAMMRRDRRLRRASISDFISYLDSVDEWLEQPENAGRRGFRGMRNCRRALRLMREGSDSSQESRSSIALMRYGFDHPEFNHPIRNPKNGKTLFIDMAYPEFRVALEYEGAHHAEQWLADVTRQQLIEDEGWDYSQITKLNLGDDEAEEKLAQRVAKSIERQTGVVVPVTERQSIRQLCDGRRMRMRPLWERLGMEEELLAALGQNTKLGTGDEPEDGLEDDLGARSDFDDHAGHNDYGARSSHDDIDDIA